MTLSMPTISNSQKGGLKRVTKSAYESTIREIEEYTYGAKIAAKEWSLEAAVHKANAAEVDAQAAQKLITIAQTKSQIMDVKVEGVKGDLSFAQETLSIRTTQRQETLAQMREKANNILDGEIDD